MTNYIKKLAKKYKSSRSTSVTDNNKIIEEIQKIIGVDTGTMISILIFCGYFFTMVQHLARYAYYGVETTYLLHIEIEKILLGTAYLIAFCAWLYLIYRMQKNKSYLSGILGQIPVCISACFLAYSLTLRSIFDFFIIFMIIVVSLNIFISLLFKFIKRKQKTIYKKSVKEIICIIFFILVILVVVLQISIESYNKRFTYIILDNIPYAILTTFKDSDFITLESNIENDKITIFWGQVKLIPISGSTIHEKQFSEKVILKP